MIISDSSTLILMSKISVLKEFLKKNKVVIPKGVYEESVMRGIEKGEADAYAINEQVKTSQIEILSVEERLKSEVKKLFGITKGENEVIGLAMKKKPKLILTDDRKCMHICIALGLDFSTCIDVVIALYKKGRIDENKALNYLNKLKEFGWYSNDIIGNRMKIVRGG